MRKRWFVGKGWVGFRPKPAPSRYYVLRDIEENPPRFSERNGYTPFHRWLKLGRWELGWK